MASKRITYTLKDTDKTWLEGYCQAHNISVAEAIRHGIGLLKEAEGDITYKALAKKTIGVWRHGDGLEYQQRSRSEWND